MKEVKKYLESRIGEYSFFFEDLKSGYVYGYNEHKEMIAAGSMKLPIAVSLIKAVQDKKVDFMQNIKIEASDKVRGNGILHEFGEREYTVFELLVAMLIQSDNTAANKIIDILGIQNINKDIEAMELLNTHLNRKTSDERHPTNNIENITSSYDLCKIWKILNNSSYLNKENSTMLIDILTRQQKKNKLALYIPEDLKYEISSKTGDKNGVENDTAFLRVDKGNFTLTVMSKNIPNSVYGTMTLARCGKMIFDSVMNNWN